MPYHQSLKCICLRSRLRTGPYLYPVLRRQVSPSRLVTWAWVKGHIGCGRLPDRPHVLRLSKQFSRKKTYYLLPAFLCQARNMEVSHASDIGSTLISVAKLSTTRTLLRALLAADTPAVGGGLKPELQKIHISCCGAISFQHVHANRTGTIPCRSKDPDTSCRPPRTEINYVSRPTSWGVVIEPCCFRSGRMVCPNFTTYSSARLITNVRYSDAKTRSCFRREPGLERKKGPRLHYVPIRGTDTAGALLLM